MGKKKSKQEKCRHKRTLRLESGNFICQDCFEIIFADVYFMTGYY